MNEHPTPAVLACPATEPAGHRLLRLGAKLSGRTSLAVGGGLVAGVVLVAGMTGGVSYAAAATAPDPMSRVCGYTSQTGTPKDDGFGLSARQTGNAKVIVETAEKLGLPRRAAEIALATAFQESRLDNDAVPRGRKSFGLFQQMPSAGWGTRKQVTTPRYATRSFYKRLTRVRQWTTMPLTKAAAIVQRPREDLRNVYAKHEKLAKRLVAALWKEPADEDIKGWKMKAEEEARVEAGVETAAGLGIPQEEVTSDLANVLQQRYGEQTESDVRKRAEEIVDSVVGRLCTEGDDSAPAEIDGSAPADEGDDSPAESGSAPAGSGSARAGSGSARAGSGSARAGSGAVNAAAVVSAALAQRGTPYSWGGGGPAGPSFGIGRGAKTKGFDCSGLTEYAWSKAGVRIGGTTYEQVKKGRKIPRSEVKPGDLVFYETDPSRPGPDHVGLAVSGKEMVNAPNTGAVVRTDAIDRQGYVTAVRPS